MPEHVVAGQRVCQNEALVASPGQSPSGNARRSEPRGGVRLVVRDAAPPPKPKQRPSGASTMSTISKVLTPPLSRTSGSGSSSRLEMHDFKASKGTSHEGVCSLAV